MDPAIDLRGRMACSLGVMLSGGTSRDHVLDTWLLRHQGDIELRGSIAAPRGTRVELGYVWHGGLTRFPVRHYVLSASSTPYGRTTRVRIGCRLTLLGNRKSLVPFRARDYPPTWYQELSDSERLATTPPVNAQRLLDWCVAGLGLTLAPGTEPLVGNMMRAEVSGDSYCKILEDLLHSHSCVGYLDPADRLVVKRISLTPRQGPVYDERTVVDIAPAGNSEGTVEKVSVRYRAIEFPQTVGEYIPPATYPGMDFVLYGSTDRIRAFTGSLQR